MRTRTQQDGAMARGRRCGGFNLPELLVVMGVIAIGMSLLAPSLGKSRISALDLEALARARQVATAIAMTFHENDDKAPVIYPKRPFDGRNVLYNVEYGGATLRGNWWCNPENAFYAVSPALPAKVLQAPKAPPYNTITLRGEPVLRESDYFLSETFYAEPAYWRRETQKGFEQWHAQRLSAVAYPSDKGFVYQSIVYHIPGREAWLSACCLDDVGTAIVWSDLSASIEHMRRLRPGCPNFFDPLRALLGPLPYKANGIPVRDTVDGVLGRDR